MKRVEHLDSCFRLVCRRNVEEIKVLFHDIHVPACVFKCQSLVVLELDRMLSCSLLRDRTIHLPNLKKLRLRLDSFCLRMMGNLLSSCPLLEDLRLVFDLLKDKHDVKISAPNLKLLDLEMVSAEQHNKIIIDTPILENLKIRDSSSFYYFVNNPTQLVTAYIDFIYGRACDWLGADDYFRVLAQFVQPLSSVSNLDLKCSIEIFPYPDPMKDGAMTFFHGLACFRTLLNSNFAWDKLLMSLQCVPNLTDLEVTMEHNYSRNYFGNWCAPDSATDCFLSKLKKITVRQLEGCDNDLKLLEYILKNTIVLEELHVYVRIGSEHKEDVRKECKFCEALFKLPRSSLTAEVVLFGGYIKSSTNALKNGLLKKDQTQF
ncbi:FBD-associated F-box protein At4g13985 [Spinacia oleracea]|uniref:FBD-associated F-box protein At4g13985 n=1 Tax=Spinacia oleracea TaxID=3562 RepID=A0ABM3RPR1_SPIOL|nr:FBD-associated F-box protein At4g13985-like [Spinacia oleracea]XP_056697599.1 FBD-associated F-box protein At4g13985-like [Spinacia oleracea]